MMVITTRNLKDVEQKLKYEMSACQIWSKAQNFSFNVILNFLELADVVKILTIVHRSRVRFAPSSMMLSKILQKALHSSLSDNPFSCVAREMRLTSHLISKDKTVRTGCLV
jgi:hypothetical protein